MRQYIRLHTFVITGALIFVSSTSIVYAASTLQEYVLLISKFIDKTLLPFIFALALLFFLVNIARFFILKGADSYEHEKAKKFALYGLAAFVFLISIWGITNIILKAFDLNDASPICPDYHPDCARTLKK